jgi:selenocysteine lyase/cysteine desulfurase
MVESIRYLLELGIENIYEHNMRLDKMLKDELEEIIGVELMRIDDHGPIVSFTVRDRNSGVIKKAL